MQKRYLLVLLLAVPLCAQVSFKQGTGRVSVEIDGKPYTELFAGPDTTKPYLHPLRAASGTIVTRHYPMEQVEGETKDHPHHRGLWFAHGDVNGFDYWGSDPTYSAKNPDQPHIVLKKVLGLKGGKKSGALTAEFDWQDPNGKPLLSEHRTMVFYSDPNLRIIDFDINLTALGPVKFGDTKEGTFAIRLAAGLEEPHRRAPANPPRTGTIINSYGQKGEANTWGKRADWVDYFGQINGEKLGVAILDHPSNPRHPTYWHVRSYGLFAANIFGLHDFLRDKTADGSLTLAPGKSLRFRYRVVIHPGDYQSAGVAEMYRKYAAMK